MKYAKALLVALLLSTFAIPQTADAQFGRLKKRAEERAKERLTQHAERKVDQAVDKVVDESVARTENRLQSWIDNAFKGSASVSEDGVLSRDGREDIQLTPNQSGPSTSDHLSYIEVTTLRVPGLAAFSGMTTASEFSLHDGRSVTDNQSDMNIIDLNLESIINADHDSKTYWQQTFAEMAAMLEQAMGNVSDQVDQAQASAGDVDDEVRDANVEMEYSFDVDDTGQTEDINGIRARRFIYTMEAIATGENDEGETMSTKFYTIIDSWVSTAVAGYETLTSFQSQMARTMMDDAQINSLADKMQGLAFLDPRIGGSMEQAAEKMKDAVGLPVKSILYMVSVPEGKQLDRGTVFSGAAGDAMTAAIEDGSEAQEQRTVMISETYISNLSGESFPTSKLEVPSNYTMVTPPMKRMLDAAEQDND